MAASLAFLLIAVCAMAQAPVYLNTGDDFGQIVAANPAGTHYIIRPGVHRGQQINAKPGDVVEGEPGAVVSGAQLLSQNWQEQDGLWVNSTPKPIIPFGGSGAYSDNLYFHSPQSVFVDDERLKRVASTALMTEPNHWYMDMATGHLYLRFNPEGRKVEITGLKAAFFTDGGGSTIRNLTVEKYATPMQTGAVNVITGGVCENCEVRFNYSYGIRANGDFIVRNNFIHNNGQDGIGTSIGAGLIEHNEISYNSMFPFRGSDFEQGGIKAASKNGLVVRRNYIHHNHGPGFWLDVNSENLQFVENIVEWNDWEGILLEISWGGEVKRNISRNNGQKFRGQGTGALWGGQICIQNASGFDIEDNFIETPVQLEGRRVGFMGINQGHRGSGKYGLHNLHHLSIKNNTFVHREWAHNGLDYGVLGWPTYADFANSEIVWSDNSYHVSDFTQHFWNWRVDIPNWGPDYYIATWMPWSSWAGYQDERSVVAPRPRRDLNPTGQYVLNLIKQRTGLDYDALRASLEHSRSPQRVDLNGNGLPDGWEQSLGLSTVGNEADEDPDGDGWTNAEEFARRTDPQSSDTDGDGIPDRIEFEMGLDPLHAELDDTDGDGLIPLEEYEDASSLSEPNPANVALPDEHLTQWLKTDAGVQNSGDSIDSWQEQSRHKRAVSLTSTAKPVFHAAPAASGAKLVTAPQPYATTAPSGGMWGNAEDGFTFSFFFRPGAVTMGSLAILTNETYLARGFRVYLSKGALAWTSIEDGGNLMLRSNTVLETGRLYLITLCYGGAGGRTSLYLDGVEQSTVWNAVVHPGSGGVNFGSIGGMVSQPGEFGDAVVFNRQLKNVERKTLERLLWAKYVSGESFAPDSDFDGMPDAYEAQSGSDPTVPDRSADSNGNGTSNWEEFQFGHDVDGDGLTLAEEEEDGSDPNVSDILRSRIPDEALAAWIKPDAGVQLAGDEITLWREQSRYNRTLALSAAAKPRIVPSASPQEKPLVNPAAPFYSPNQDQVWGTEDSGFTLSFIYKPLEITSSGSRAVLTNEVYLKNGFRFYLNNGRPTWSSVQSGGDLFLQMANPLPEAQVCLVTLSFASFPGRSVLYINGKEQASSAAKSVLPGEGSLMLGGIPGMETQAGLFGDVVAFSRRLTHLERKTLERVLWAKYVEGGDFAPDSDFDGLPDDYEVLTGRDVHTPDASVDADYDGYDAGWDYLLGVMSGGHPRERDVRAETLDSGVMRLSAIRRQNPQSVLSVKLRSSADMQHWQDVPWQVIEPLGGTPGLERVSIEIQPNGEQFNSRGFFQLYRNP